MRAQSDLISDLASPDQAPADVELLCSISLPPIEPYEPRRFAVVSQTCDVIRPADRRPFVSISPIVIATTETDVRKASAGHWPNLAPVPILGPDAFAALDLVYTLKRVDIPTEAVLERGCPDAPSLSLFARIAGRKFGRFAFPNELHGVLAPLQTAVEKKFGGQGDTSKLFADLEQVRISAEPAWEALGEGDPYEATVHLIFRADGVIPAVGNEVPIPQLASWDEATRTGHRAHADVASRILTTGDEDQRQWLARIYAQAWTAKLESARAAGDPSPLEGIELTVETADDFSVDQFWRSRRLDIDWVTDRGE